MPADNCLGIVAELGRRVLLLLLLLGTLFGSLLGSFLLGHSTSSLKVRAANSSSLHLAALCWPPLATKPVAREPQNIRELASAPRTNIPSARPAVARNRLSTPFDDWLSFTHSQVFE
jgi:hypothetical protein